MHARITFTPAQPEAIARFSLSVPLGNGVMLSCYGGTIIRRGAQLAVLYPHGRSHGGTWAFGGSSQPAFDNWVLSRFRIWLETGGCQATSRNGGGKGRVT